MAKAAAPGVACERQLVDLSFPHPEQGVRAIAVALPADLAVLMAGVVARQATSPTALVQAHLEGREAAIRFGFATSGAFHTLAAELLNNWKQE